MFRPGGCTALPAPGIPVALARSPPSTGGAYMGAPNAVGRALPRRRNGTRTSFRCARPSCAPSSVLSRRCVAHVTTLLNFCLNFFFLFFILQKKGPRLRAVGFSPGGRESNPHMLYLLRRAQCSAVELPPDAWEAPEEGAMRTVRALPKFAAGALAVRSQDAHR